MRARHPLRLADAAVFVGLFFLAAAGLALAAGAVFRAPSVLRPAVEGLPSRSAIRSSASLSETESGAIDFGIVALTLPQLT